MMVISIKDLYKAIININSDDYALHRRRIAALRGLSRNNIIIIPDKGGVMLLWTLHMRK